MRDEVKSTFDSFHKRNRGHILKFENAQRAHSPLLFVAKRKSRLAGLRGSSITADPRTSADRIEETCSELGPNSPQDRWAVREIKAILDSYGRSIHSLVLFGSYAMGNATPRSDIDFLVLLKAGEEARRLRKILFDFKMALGNESRGELPVEIQIVDLDEQEIEQIFELSTPLAHALRHAVIIRDDGWFQQLLLRPYPGWPARKAAVMAFTRWIVCQYYRCAIDLKREIRKDHGPQGICTRLYSPLR